MKAIARRACLAIVFAAGVIFTLSLIGSLWFHRLAGVELIWDLKTGSFRERRYVFGMMLGEKAKLSSLEAVFDSVQQRRLQEMDVMLYSKSFIQPERGGNWMRVLFYAKYLAASEARSETEKTQLVDLVRAGDSKGLREWYESAIDAKAYSPAK